MRLKFPLAQPAWRRLWTARRRSAILRTPARDGRPREGDVMSRFRIALSGDLVGDDGTPTLPTLEREPEVEYAYVGRGPVLSADELEGFDALILLMPQFRAESVPSGGRLSVIARCGVGYDTVDVDACTDNGIALVITPEAVRRPVAVMVITFMLALSGNLLALDRITRKGPWRERTNYTGVGLVGRTLGQIGVGNIGTEVLRLAKAFGLELIGNDPYIDQKAIEDLGATPADLETVLRESDFVSLSVPLTDETRAMINAERLALMKPTAFVINTARGPVVDQKALAEALRRRSIAGAGLDVLENEPPDPDDPILTLDNVVLTPHSLCWTDQTFEAMAGLDIEACLEVMHGRSPRNLVNQEVLQSARFRERLAAYAAAFGS
jgi:phosphoglycerate dehydrogenase-like enzyme